jgi:hypothetical protein
MRRAEGGEVVPPDERLRRALHRLGIERAGDVPRAAALERQRRAAVADAVEVAPADAREARVPVVGLGLAREHRDRLGPQPRVERFHQPERVSCLGDVDMADHRQRVHPAVGAPGAVQRRVLAGDLEHRALDRFLHRGPWPCRCRPMNGPPSNSR